MTRRDRAGDGGGGSDRRSGFTLVETLAALAVASSVIIGAAALVHHVAIFFDRGVRGVSDAERFTLAMERLSRDFAAASFVAATSASARADPPGENRRKEPGKDAEKLPPVAFEGDAAKIIFVSASAVGARAAQEEALTLSIESAADESTRLVRRRAVWLGPRAGLFAGEARDAVVLLEGRYAISFSYARMNARGELAWSDRWKGEIELPRLIRLNLRDSTTGASLVAAADFIVRADAPPFCVSTPETCFLDKPGASLEPPAREPT